MFEETPREVNRTSGVEDNVYISREQESFLLVFLKHESRNVEVHRSESNGETHRRGSLTRSSISKVSVSFRVVDGREVEHGEGREGEREDDVEVEETVQDVVVPRFGTV